MYIVSQRNDDYAKIALDLLKKNNLLNDGAIIVVEHKFANDLQNLPDWYIMKKSKKYGIAYVDVLEYKE